MMQAEITRGEIVEDPKAVRDLSRLRVRLVVKLETPEHEAAAQFFADTCKGGIKWPEVKTLKDGSRALVVCADRALKPIE